jgi:hypothetical protein
MAKKAAEGLPASARSKARAVGSSQLQPRRLRLSETRLSGAPRLAKAEPDRVFPLLTALEADLELGILTHKVSWSMPNNPRCAVLR